MPEKILIISVSVLLFHYLFFIMKITRGLSKLRSNNNWGYKNLFVSVIIPFRNEENNLPENVSSIQNVSFNPDQFEIIYVNDHSSDNSVEVLKSLVNSDNIKILSVPDDYSINAHKKRAIRFGIENSKGDIIVTSDADCTYNQNWLNSLLGNFDDETGFVSGPVKFKSEEKFFSQLQQLEFAGLVITGAGLIGGGSPIICNAANIAYRKNAFDEVKGFNDNLNISSGDDEFLMQKVSKSKKYKVKFSVNPDSFVETAANKNLNEFYHQRKRWASKGLFYNSKLLILRLVLIFLFFLSIILLPFTSAWFGKLSVYLFLISFLAKLIYEYLLLFKGKLVFFRDLSLKHFLIAEIFHIPYILIAGISGLFGNYLWKERRVPR